MNDIMTVRLHEVGKVSAVVKDAVVVEKDVPGVGVPPGGASGQVLTKLSDADYDTGWRAAIGGGENDHSKLTNRDAQDQHPIGAIAGLAEALDGKQPKGDYLTADTLQDATNNALAQAKASGEFDGPAGAPGKDAATDISLGITGATVGQIAKITAVDASGVPTAWEPVDMPGGGDENFALIMDDTVPANATGYTSDKDVNGESFALREWVLILWTPAHTDDDHGNFGRVVGFIPGSAWGKNAFKISDTIKKSDGTGRYDMLHIKVVDGYQMQLLHTRSQNASNAFGVMQQDVAAGIAPINFKVDATALFEPTNATGYATCVKIAGYTNENVPAGTRIKLYGKRVKS